MNNNSTSGTSVVPRLALSTAEAAASIGVSAKTLRNWRSAGRGPVYVKLGNRVSYRTTDLDAWLADQVVGGAAV